MGKLHKRFNWKSRQIVKTIIDETEQNKIKVEFQDDSCHYDASNALVLPSSKRKTKRVKNKDAAPVKLLSKKQRKKLMKINEQKLKKMKRENLLEELKKVQAKPKDMAVLTSLQSTQTLGRKKFLNPSFTSISLEEKVVGDKNIDKYFKWKTPKAVKRDLREKQQPPKKRLKDFTVVQSESSSSSEDESESETEKETSNPDLVTIENDDEKKNEDHKCSEENSENYQEHRNKETQQSNESSEKNLNSDNYQKNNKDEKHENHDVVDCTSKFEQKDLLLEKARNETSKDKTVNKTFKRVERNPEVQKQRLKLPILSEEHTVMEAVNENPVTIIVGQTGSGKTTQVPQFLYEAGYTSNGKMIGVTEPRRVAAISMSERVGFEMDLPSKVSYQVRFDGNTTSQTEVKFMTDGVLFKEVMQSHLLENYSAIIIDEAHERSIHSDILIGLLSRIVPKRTQKGNPLKLIIMSATLRIEDFTQNSNLFRDVTPPVVRIEPRMFDVTIHFNKETDPEYCSAAYRKICKIHRQLPDGGILVFLTGQQEINDLRKKLRATFPVKKIRENEEKDASSFQTRIRGKKEKSKKHKRKRNGLRIPEVNLKEFSSSRITASNDDEDCLSDDISNEFLVEAEQPLWVLPLYSLLPRHKQKMVFEPPPEGTRLCVVATNVAETSLTIPSIKYVVDSGKTKEKVYDPVTGVSSYHVVWTSKASANQRAGRAGRTSDGFCYRLYSSAVFNDEFEQYSIPDIQKRPLDDVVLTMKALKVPVIKFPFPSPPDPTRLSQSFKSLTVLGALKEEKYLNKGRNKTRQLIDSTVITEMGKSMAALPVAPRFAKMILYSNQHEGILPYIIIIITALTVQEVLVEIPLGGKTLSAVQKHWEAQRIQWSGTGASHLLGDLLILIRAVLEAEQNKASYQWCQENGIRHAALSEIRKLRRQLTNEINVLMPETNVVFHPNMKPPTNKQACIIAEVVLMGSLDQVVRKVEEHELITMPDKKIWKNAYRSLYSGKPVFLSSASALHKDKPRYAMYQDIYETTKIYLRGITAIDEAWLIHHGGDLVDLSPPLDVPAPSFNFKKDLVVCCRKGTFGPEKWPLREYEVSYPLGKDLFKWVAYFFLTGKLWPVLELYVGHLYDPKTLISPVSLRYKDKRENLVRAFMSRNVTSAKSLENVWKQEPNYLKSQYFAWFEDESKLGILNSKWPPLKEVDHWYI